MFAAIVHHDLPLALVLLHTATLRWYASPTGEIPPPSRFGFPFPFAGWSGVSSLEWVVDPQIMAMNLAALAVMVGATRWCVTSVGNARRTRRKRLAVGAAASWVGLVKACAALLVVADLLFVAGGLVRTRPVDVDHLLRLDRVEACAAWLSPATGDPPMWCGSALLTPPSASP